MESSVKEGALFVLLFIFFLFVTPFPSIVPVWYTDSAY